MFKKKSKAGCSGPACRLAAPLITTGLMLLPAFTLATNSQVFATPDSGIRGCVSFKHSQNTNPLDFTFGYACVSTHYCEVSAHGCVDKYCEQFDYSTGARTTLSNIPTATRVDQINMAPSGEDLAASNAAWCLIQDGAGNFWALDKLRGSLESFTQDNQYETIIRCQTSDYFSNHKGCISGNYTVQ